MTPLGLSWRSARRQPARALLGIAGIAAVGALLLDMLLLSRGLLVSFGELLDSIGFDVRVTATETMPTQGPPIASATRIVDAIRRLPEVEEAVPIRVGRASVVRPGGGGGARFDVNIIAHGEGFSGRRAWTLIRGATLVEASRARGAGPPPILVNRSFAAAFGLEPGSTVRIAGETHGAASALPSVEFRVAGIADFAFEAAGESNAVMTLEGFRQVHGGEDRDEADLLLVASAREAGADAAVAAIRRLHPELYPFSNEQFLLRFSRTDFSYFRQISFVLSSVTLFFAFLLVVTLLTVAVNQRFAEVAALRAIGFSRRRVAADLLAESAFLVGSGALFSLPLGAGLARVLDTILRAMPGIPERLHFFVFEARTVLLHLVLLALAGFLAALYPASIAVRLPIAATLRREVVS